MKKGILFVLILLFGVSAFAQESESLRKVYCELVGTGKFLSSKIVVTVDFGQETKFLTGLSQQYLVDENGKAKDFNSMVDAMNFMGKLGWEFEQAYVVTVSQQNVYHWLLSKTILNEEELKDGIKTKDQYKKENKDKTQNKETEESSKFKDDVYK
jgi:hypothetical protein